MNVLLGEGFCKYRKIAIFCDNKFPIYKAYRSQVAPNYVLCENCCENCIWIVGNRQFVWVIIQVLYRCCRPLRAFKTFSSSIAAIFFAGKLNLVNSFLIVSLLPSSAVLLHLLFIYITTRNFITSKTPSCAIFQALSGKFCAPDLSYFYQYYFN